MGYQTGATGVKKSASEKTTSDIKMEADTDELMKENASTKMEGKELGGGEGSESDKNIVTFNDWNTMKNHYKGTLTKFLSNNKPKGSPVPKRWFENGGSLEIETLKDGSQIWRYTSAKGDTVPYINKRVKFPPKYMHPDLNIAEFNLKTFTGDRNLDKQQALEYIKKFGYTKIPKNYVLHHGIDNGVYQLVRKDIHELFTHYGGHYYNK